MTADDEMVPRQIGEALRDSEARIQDGRLPYCLEGEDWRRYRGAATLMTQSDIPSTASQLRMSAWIATFWETSWCRMWFNITYVRLQAFERDQDADEAARDWE